MYSYSRPRLFSKDTVPELILYQAVENYKVQLVITILYIDSEIYLQVSGWPTDQALWRRSYTISTKNGQDTLKMR